MGEGQRPTFAEKTQLLFNQHEHSLKILSRTSGETVFEVPVSGTHYRLFLDGIALVRKYQEFVKEGMDQDANHEKELYGSFAFFFQKFIAPYIAPLQELYGEGQWIHPADRNFPNHLVVSYRDMQVDARVPKNHSPLVCTYTPTIVFFDFQPGSLKAKAFLERTPHSSLSYERGLMHDVLESILSGMYCRDTLGMRFPPDIPELRESPGICFETQDSPRRVYVSSPRSLITVIHDLQTIPGTCDATSPVKFWQLVAREKKRDVQHATIAKRVRKEWYY